MASFHAFNDFEPYIDTQDVYNSHLVMDQNEPIPSTISNLWPACDQNYGYHQPLHLLASMAHSYPPQEMRVFHTLHPTYLQRHQSPSGSHHSGSSECSSGGDSASSTEAHSYPIRCPASPVYFSKDHTLKMIDIAPDQNMPWQPVTDSAFTYSMNALVPMVPSQAHMEIDQQSFSGEDEADVPDDFHNKKNVHEACARSPQNMLQPEELELSDTIKASADITDVRAYHAKKSIKEYGTDVEIFEDEDEDAIIDNDSDSDYQSQPRKRKMFRSGSHRNNKSPNSRRKSSSQALVGQPRVHKRTQSNTSNANGGTFKSTGRGKSRKGPGPVFKQSTISNTPLAKGERKFPCTFRHFGCNMEFPNKNEWKRHVACQHLQLGFFRCDLDECNPDNQSSSDHKVHDRRRSSQMRAKRPVKFEREGSDPDEIIKIYNDFNRKDLFTQHCRRMHGPSRNPELCSARSKKGAIVPTKEDEMAFEKDLENIRTRCWQVRRKAPSSVKCGFCSRLFDACYFRADPTTSKSDIAGSEDKAWEEYMEHVGKHFERGDIDLDEEETDEDFIQWGLDTGVLNRLENGTPWLVSADLPSAGNQTRRSRRGDSGQDEEKKKARRQPRRTVVIERRQNYEASAASSSLSSASSHGEKHGSQSEVSDEDADAETE